LIDEAMLAPVSIATETAGCAVKRQCEGAAEMVVVLILAIEITLGGMLTMTAGKAREGLTPTGVGLRKGPPAEATRRWKCGRGERISEIKTATIRELTVDRSGEIPTHCNVQFLHFTSDSNVIAFLVFIIVSDLDADPCGSVLKWLPWIRIRIGNANPDPGQSKWCPKGKKSKISS